MSTSRPLDERWYRRLREVFVADDNWITNFCTVPPDEQTRFLAGEVENPRFMLCSTETMHLDVYEATLRDLHSQVATEEHNDHVRALYLKKIERQLGLLPMYRASEEKDDAAFVRHSVAHYGKPKRMYFAYVAKRVKELLAAQAATGNPASLRALARVFSKIDTSNVTISSEALPSVATDVDDTITARETAVIFEAAIERLGIEGWSIVIDDSCRRRYISVNSQKRRVYIPCDQRLRERAKPFTRHRAEAVAEHEIGVHAYREYNGSKSCLQLLAIGLPEYIRGEEGLASYVQQQYEGAGEFYGFDRYLALSLAIGLDGTPRDFRAVFEILTHYYQLTIELPANHQLAQHAAWNTSVRCFRGTTGLSVGTVYTKDSVYLEGNIGIWNLLIDKPHVFPQLFVGKFDPLNREHVARLSALGIITEY